MQQHRLRPSACSRRALLIGAIASAAGLASGAIATHATGTATPQAAVPTREHLVNLMASVPAALLTNPDPAAPIFCWLGKGYADPTMVASADPLWRSASHGEDVASVFGFAPGDCDDILTVGSLLDPVTWYDLPVDDEWSATWEANGFVRMEDEAGPFWTIAADGMPSMDLRAAQLGESLANCIARTERGVVVARSTERLLAARTLDAPADAAGDPLRSVLDAVPETAVNVLAWPGSALQASALVPEGGDGSAFLAESDAAVGAMPEPIAIVGCLADDGPSITLCCATAEDAALASEVVAWRIANMTSPTMRTVYAEAWSGVSVDVVEDRVLVDFSSSGSSAAWHQTLLNRDVWPFAW